MNRRQFLLAVPLIVAVVTTLYWGAPLRAWAVGSGTHTVVATLARPLTPDETRKIESYMRHVLGNPGIKLVPTPPDAEVFLGEHFLGVVYPDDQKDGRTFYFEMAIFDEELKESPPARRGR